MADGETAMPHPGGRPRKYSDPSEFDAAVEAYFDATDYPMITELSLSLGFQDIESFTHYETYGPEFSRTVKRARMRVEIDRHKRLINKDTFNTGLIFDLKNNHGWKDQQHQELSGKVYHEVRRTLVRPTHSDG